MNLLIYFIIGAIENILATIDVRAVQQGRAYLSATMGFILGIIGWLVFVHIAIFNKLFTVTDLETYIHAGIGILSYELGGFVGTVLAMKKKLK